MPATTPISNIDHIASKQNQKEVTANTPFDQFDQMINDILSTDCSGSTDVTANVDGATYAKVLKLTGTLTADINFIVPKIKHVWIVSNQSTGTGGCPPESVSITVKYSTGTGIEVEQGQIVVLYGEGTNVTSIVLDRSAFTSAPVAAPTTTSSVGVTGTWSYDGTYLYVCTATNTWGRIAFDFAF